MGGRRYGLVAVFKIYLCTFATGVPNFKPSSMTSFRYRSMISSILEGGRVG